MGLKFGKAVTMIVERYGWSAFDNLSAINDPDLCKAVEMVRKVRKKKDDIHANKTGADLRRARPPREKIEKMVDKGMTYAEIGEAIGSTPGKQDCQEVWVVRKILVCAWHVQSHQIRFLSQVS